MSPLKLEVFKTSDMGMAAAVGAENADAEEARLAAYEQGYTAGWDDSSAATNEDQRRLAADLARNLQALSFTYHEARSHVLRAIGPLLEDITLSLLPDLAREALAPVVLETLMPLAEQMAEVSVTLVLNPVARPAVEALLEQATGLPVVVREEPSLGEGQVYFLFGEAETRVDLDRAKAEIIAAVRGFFQLNEKERKYG